MKEGFSFRIDDGAPLGPFSAEDMHALLIRSELPGRVTTWSRLTHTAWRPLKDEQGSHVFDLAALSVHGELSSAHSTVLTDEKLGLCYWGDDGWKHGPFRVDEVKAWFDGGHLQDKTLMCTCCYDAVYHHLGSVPPWLLSPQWQLQPSESKPGEFRFVHQATKERAKLLESELMPKDWCLVPSKSRPNEISFFNKATLERQRDIRDVISKLEDAGEDLDALTDLFSTATLEESSPTEAQESVSPSPEVESTYLVVDTNILLDQDEFAALKALRLRSCCVVVPAIATWECDKKQTSVDVRLAKAARAAVRWCRTPGHIRGQRDEETVKLMRREVADDDVLSCAVFYARNCSPRTLLLTKDAGLQNKARSHYDLHAYTAVALSKEWGIPSTAKEAAEQAAWQATVTKPTAPSTATMKSTRYRA